APGAAPAGAHARPPGQPEARAQGASRPESRRPEGTATAGGEGRRGEGGGQRTLQPLTVTIREPGAWPRTATTTLTLNPFTGEELKREGFGDFSTGRQLRTWTRFLHTGQALGWGGQFIAGLACLGGCFLVYTGFALSWRRFFFKKQPGAAAPSP
ncbi:MAG: PepSY-associated TM helix domain-containing protein, partial [Oleiharenicola lentus]